MIDGMNYTMFEAPPPFFLVRKIQRHDKYKYMHNVLKVRTKSNFETHAGIISCPKD